MTSQQQTSSTDKTGHHPITHRWWPHNSEELIDGCSLPRLIQAKVVKKSIQ